MKRRGLLNKHFCKRKFQISPLRQIFLANFHFSNYKSMGTISCHSNQSSYLTGIKNIPFRSLFLLMLYMEYGKNRSHGFRGLTASEEMSFENVDGRTTDGRTPDACIYY